jgi:hypothetical protein
LNNYFKFEEAYHVLRLIGTLDPRDAGKDVPPEFQFKLSNEVAEDDVYVALLSVYEYAQFDKRAYLTLDGPVLPYVIEPTETFQALNDISIPDEEDISVICAMEGIPPTIEDEKKPSIVLMFEWAVSQLSSTFMSHVGEHRERVEAMLYERNSMEQVLYEFDEKEVVYFGQRDGMEKVVGYTLEELYHTFKRPSDANDGAGTGYFYDPISIARTPIEVLKWEAFPRRAVVRLTTLVLPQKSSRWAQKLMKECREILASSKGVELGKAYLDITISQLKRGDKSKVTDVFLAMLNSGQTLMKLDDDFDDYSDAFMQMYLVDPKRVPYEPHLTGRPQVEYQNAIFNIVEKISASEEMSVFFNSLPVVMQYYGRNVVQYENPDFRLGRFLDILLRMASYNMTTWLILAGRWLYITSAHYFNLVFRRRIDSVSFHMEEGL